MCCELDQKWTIIVVFQRGLAFKEGMFRGLLVATQLSSLTSFLEVDHKIVYSAFWFSQDTLLLYQNMYPQPRLVVDNYHEGSVLSGSNQYSSC